MLFFIEQTSIYSANRTEKLRVQHRVSSVIIMVLILTFGLYWNDSSSERYLTINSSEADCCLITDLLIQTAVRLRTSLEIKSSPVVPSALALSSTACYTLLFLQFPAPADPPCFAQIKKNDPSCYLPCMSPTLRSEVLFRPGFNICFD